MHTIVVISNHSAIDINMLKSMETLFPECRIEVVDVAKGRNLQRVDDNQKCASVRLKSSHNN